MSVPLPPTTVSVQLPDLLVMLKVSVPPQPINESLPDPEVKVSLPAPPTRLSLPDVPLKVCALVDVDCKSAAETSDDEIPESVSNVSLPFFIRVSLPLATIVKPDERKDESKPIASVPSAKSVRVSLPEDDVITITSLPVPDVIVSSPAPPSRVSSPSSP